MAISWESVFDAEVEPDPVIEERNPLMEETLRKEFALFRASGGRGKLLTLCRNIILGIPPTSVRPEQDFSVVKLLLGERRSSLNPDTLDAIFILRKAFQNKVI